jgi:uncharacterized membrane protein HdeD (DUF308 family)
MEHDRTTGSSRDILSSLPSAFALFWLPAIAIAVTARSNFGAGWRTLVWTVSLGTMGAACLINAVRCGRVHCYVTGPFFVLMAVATLLYGVGILPLGAKGWSLLGLTILVGAIALCCVPELFLGRYRKSSSRER